VGCSCIFFSGVELRSGFRKASCHPVLTKRRRSVGLVGEEEDCLGLVTIETGREVWWPSCRSGPLCIRLGTKFGGQQSNTEGGLEILLYWLWVRKAKRRRIIERPKDG
jgi:hypothetical protein